MAEYNHEKYYWIKLKQSLMTSKAVDFLMSQKDGANYVVLYQCLCLKTINQNGELADRIGEIIVPFDENKIQRETKWFSLDTIRVAMSLYKQLGLIYEQADGILRISNFQDLIGSQTISAYKKQLQIKARVENRVEQKVENIPPENKSIENKILDIDNKEKSVEKKDMTPFNNFIETFKINVDNYSGMINEMDFTALLKIFSENKWLQTNFISLSKICKEYHHILGGYYKDFEKPKPKDDAIQYDFSSIES